MQMDPYYELARFYLYRRSRYFRLKLSDFNSEVPGPLYSLRIDFFFVIRPGLLAFSNQALGFVDQPYSIRISFPVTYGDLVFSCFTSNRIPFRRLSNLDEYPKKCAWELLSEAETDYTKYSSILNKKPTTYLIKCAISYFLYYLYFRVCSNVGCAHAGTDTLLALKDISDLFTCYAFPYLSSERVLVLNFVLDPVYTTSLFPMDYLLAHPKYFLPVPFSEAIFLSKEHPELGYCLSHIRENFFYERE